MDDDNAFTRFLTALPDNYTLTGPGRAQARCPAHDDTNPSLSVTAIEGSFLLYCHAGCDPLAVLEAVGLEAADFYDDPRGARYEYVDGRIVRRDPTKRFRQTGNTRGSALFHVERLEHSTGPVYVTEGEKDVLAVEAAGGAAVCSAMGAGKANRFDWTPLAGRHVFIVTDDDPPGLRHAADIYQITQTLPDTTVRIVKAQTGKDAADHIAAGHPLEAFVDITPDPLAAGQTDDTVDKRNFAPLEYHVPDLVPEGMGVLAAPPKSGKSWLVFGLAIAVSAGTVALGHIKVPTARPVLYMALEDGWRRLQERGRAIGNGWAGGNITLIITAEGYGEARGLMLEFLRRHGTAHPLIVVDTFGRIKPQRPAGADAYQHDYQVAAELKQLIDTCPGASLLMVHHTRKQETADFVDSLSGSYGLPAAADYILALKRKRHCAEALLSITGRDVTEGEYALSATNGLWVLDGDDLPEAANAAHSRHVLGNLGDRAIDILEYVNHHGGTGQYPTPNGQFPTPEGPFPTLTRDITAEFGLSSDQASVYLNRLVERGLIRKLGRGKYGPLTVPVRSVGSVCFTDNPNTPNRDNTPVLDDSPNPSDRFNEPRHPPPPSKHTVCTKCGTQLIQAASIERGICEECHRWPPKNPT